MTTLLGLTWLLLQVAHGSGPLPPASQVPDRPGIFATTDQGVIELPVYGERQQVEAAIPRFFYRRDALGRIPVVSSVRAFHVNLMGWKAVDLYLLVGRKSLETPREDYYRLNGRAYSRGPVVIDIVTEDLEPAALQEAYRKLAGKKKRRPEDAEAYVVVEVRNAAGLSGRCYPVRVEIAPEPPEK